MVGMARNKSPYLGIIATPYRVEQEGRIFKPHIKIGYVGQNKAYRTDDMKNWIPL